MSEEGGVTASGDTGGTASVASSGRKRATGEAAAGPATAPATVGAALRQAREAAGLSLDEVANRTKVRPGLLKAIEADDHDTLPALTYSVGFVKAFARTVGLDANQIGERYRSESQKGDPVPTMVDMQPLDARRMPSKLLVATVSFGLVLALGLFWAWGAGLFGQATPPPPVVAESQATIPVVADDDFPDQETPPADTIDPAAVVTLTANTEVWLKISDKVSGDTFFMGTMAPAQVLTLPPGKPWVLRTGRAGALDVKVGERAIPPLGGPAETVRALSLAPADLAAIPTPAAGGLAPMKPVERVTTPAGAPAGTAAPAGVSAGNVAPVQ